MIVTGGLVPITRGVHLAGGAPLTYEARLWAAVLATGGVLARATAARLWGVLDDDAGVVHVALPHSRRVAIPPGVRLHRHVIAPAEIRHRSGLPSTSRTVALLDVLATAPFSEASRLADRAVQKGWLVAGDCERRLRTQPCRPGNRQLRRLLASIDGAAADSERILHRLLRKAGIRGWIPNHDVWSSGDLVAVIDVAFPQLRLAIEVDGMAYHVDVDRFRRDRRRQNSLVALGWTVLRFTWFDLTQRPGYVVATIRRLLARSGSVDRAYRG
jgi:very-short-patch-repair endonuclease